MFATYFGAEAIVASGGAVYEKGLSGALVDPVGYAGAIVIVGVFFARALWSRGLTTFADLFRQRYSPGVERLVVVVLLPGSVIWAAAQVRAFGQVLSANSGIEPGDGDHAGGRSGGRLFGGRRTAGGRRHRHHPGRRGGRRAGHPGGGGGHRMWEASRRASRRSSPSSCSSAAPMQGLLDTLEQLAIPICGTIVAVELISRFLGARTARGGRHRHRARRRNLSAVGAIPVFLGLRRAAASPADVPDAEQIVPRLAEHLLPGVLYVAFVGAIISAILSAVHAALHAPASQISHNIVVRLFPA